MRAQHAPGVFCLRVHEARVHGVNDGNDDIVFHGLRHAERVDRAEQQDRRGDPRAAQLQRFGKIGGGEHPAAAALELLRDVVPRPARRRWP